jgi:hypothetical protein
LKALNAEDFTLVPLRQVHSDAIELIAGLGSSPGRRASASVPRIGDGMISDTPRLLLSVQTADCLPILLVDSKQKSVAAIHAGWRGTLQRIAMKAVGKMRMEFGTRPGNVIAALGPSIGPCCYEVGYEVAREFDSQFAGAALWFDEKFETLAAGDDPNPLPWLTMAPPGHPAHPPRTRLDLAAANREILIGAGLRPENIFVSGLCTSCRIDLFFSHRKETNTGRLLNSLGIRPIAVAK